MIGLFLQEVQATETLWTLRALFLHVVCKSYHFFYGNKRDEKARNTFDESMHKVKDISDRPSFECSLSSQIITDRYNFLLRIIRTFINF